MWVSSFYVRRNDDGGNLEDESDKDESCLKLSPAFDRQVITILLQPCEHEFYSDDIRIVIGI